MSRTPWHLKSLEEQQKETLETLDNLNQQYNNIWQLSDSGGIQLKPEHRNQFKQIREDVDWKAEIQKQNQRDNQNRARQNNSAFNVSGINVTEPISPRLVGMF